MNGINKSKWSGATAWAPIWDAIWLRPNVHARMTTTSVVSPTEGLIPMTIPNARLHARRRGVTPPRSSGRSILQRTNSRMDSGRSTSNCDALRLLFGCERTVWRIWWVARSSAAGRGQPLSKALGLVPRGVTVVRYRLVGFSVVTGFLPITSERGAFFGDYESGPKLSTVSSGNRAH
jgi:hypothetical protein